MTASRTSRSRSPAAAKRQAKAASSVNEHSRYGDTPVQKFGDATVGSLGADDIVDAVAELRSSFAREKTLSREWRIGQLKAFKKMITEGKDQLCEAMRADLHKAPFEGMATELMLVVSEVDLALAHLDEWMKPSYTRNSAFNIPSWSSTQQDPLGVVLVMGAWNYPVMLTLAPVVGAIAGGNCVMIKPGSYALACSHAIARLVLKYLDPECIKVAEGDRAVTRALLEQRYDKICYTGSAFVGKMVLEAASKHLTPCLLELGGKSPCIVDKSANLEHAAKRLVWAAFVNGGQTCVRPDFLLVHADVADAFLPMLKRTMRECYGDDPQTSEWFGRCINDSAFRRLEALVHGAKDKLYAGGRVDAKERYIEPTLLDYGTDLGAFCLCEAMQDEIFGPILPIGRFRDIEDVIDIIKKLPTGKPLAMYCYSTDGRVNEAVKRRTTSGGLNINDCMMHLVNHELPFGGVGASGMGSYHGHRTFLAFTHEKAVLEKSPLLDQSPLLRPLLAARFPPYTPIKQALVGIFAHPLMESVVNVHKSSAFKLALLGCIGYALGLRLTWEEPWGRSKL